MRKAGGILVVLVAILATAGCSTLFPFGPPPLKSDVSITILHTDEMRAHGLASGSVVGFSRIAGYAGALKKEGRNVLLLDAGDTFHGQPWSDIDQGAPVAELMKLADYDAMTPGRRDYDYGVDRLLELSKSVGFPVLAANVKRRGKAIFPSYIVKDVEGVRVAIFGLDAPESSDEAELPALEGLVFGDPVAAARRLIDSDLKGKYDILVCLADIGGADTAAATSVSVAEACPEIDLIIDGYGRTGSSGGPPHNPTKVAIVQADTMGVALGRVDLVVGIDRKVRSLIARSVRTADAPTMPSDPEVRAAAEAMVAAEAPSLDRVIGQTAIDLVGQREIVRSGESNLGRLVANGMLATSGADIAMINGGGISDGIPAGPITKGEVYAVLPRGDYLCATPLTGAEFKAVLENGLSELPASGGRFPHIAGATFIFDAGRPAGDRVTSIMVQGKPYDPAGTYSFCTVGSEMDGGDGYATLAGRKYKEYGLDSDSLMAYLTKLGTVTEDNIPYRK